MWRLDKVRLDHSVIAPALKKPLSKDRSLNQKLSHKDHNALQHRARTAI